MRRSYNLEKYTPIYIYSIPIMIAKGSRSSVSNIAKGLANLGHCASKKCIIGGVKFHLFAQHQKHALPHTRIS